MKLKEKNLRVGIFLAMAIVLYVGAVIGYMLVR